MFVNCQPPKKITAKIAVPHQSFMLWSCPGEVVVRSWKKLSGPFGGPKSGRALRVIAAVGMK